MSSRFSGPGPGPAEVDPLRKCETAEDHARRASLLLAGVDALEERMDSLDDDQRLQMQINGGFTRTNRNLEFTVRCATAHAMTSIALQLGERDRGEGGE